MDNIQCVGFNEIIRNGHQNLIDILIKWSADSPRRIMYLKSCPVLKSFSQLPSIHRAGKLSVSLFLSIFWIKFIYHSYF